MAVIGCCRSVGKPGYTCVLMLIGRSLPSARTRILSSASFTCTPISKSFAVSDSMCVGIAPRIITSPRVAAAAIISVPVSIWSGITA